MSRTSSLHRIQELDVNLLRCHARVEEIRLILENDEGIVRLAKALESLEEALQSARAANSKAEHAVASQRSKIEQTEKTLYGGSVRDPKELQDRQQEAESLKKYLATLEDRLLETMIAMEEDEHRHHAASVELAEAKETLAASHKDLKQERELLLTDIMRLETEREAALADVDPEDLALYEELRQPMGNVVVTLVIGENCGACGLNLARSVLQSTRTGDELVRCNQCKRILYAG